MPAPTMRPAVRALAGFWAVLLLLAAGGAAILQLLGPPRTPIPREAAPREAAPREAAAARRSAPSAPTPATPRPSARFAADGGTAGAPVAASPGPAPPDPAPPDPALAEPAPDLPGRTLPRVGPNGLAPARAYASRAGLPAAGQPRGPQVAILLEDIGPAADVTAAAIEQLPAAISLGVSPYAAGLDGPGTPPFLERARRAGHETWLSLPMEPAGSPLDDEGARALSTAGDLAANRRALEWSLSRFAGYVGVTNALSGLRGDRFAASGAFGTVTEALTQRGLLYLDAGSPSAAADAAPPPGPGVRRADLTIDEQPDAADIEARLGRLEALARAHGSALGVAGPLRPVVIERLRAWSGHLAERGIALVPASALPPPALAAPSAPTLVPPGQVPPGQVPSGPVPSGPVQPPPAPASPVIPPPAPPAAAAPAQPPIPRGPP